MSSKVMDISKLAESTLKKHGYHKIITDKERRLK